MVLIKKLFKFFRKKNSVLKDQEVNEYLDMAMRNIARNLSHEMRTPLSAIKMGISSIKEYFPALLQAHKIAMENHLPVIEIQPRHLEMLQKTLYHIETELHFASMYINVLVTNLKPVEVDSMAFQACSILSCLEKAFEQYPYRSPRQKQLAYCHLPWEKDFIFHGDEMLMIYLFMNLIRNSLYHIEDMGKGEIEIKFSRTEHNNILHFKDTAKGIPDSQRQVIFDKFSTGNAQSIGLGLSFCQKIMRELGGSIACHSIEGQFTEFLLGMPIIEK